MFNNSRIYWDFWIISSFWEQGVPIPNTPRNLQEHLQWSLNDIIGDLSFFFILSCYFPNFAKNNTSCFYKSGKNKLKWTYNKYRNISVYKTHRKQITYEKATDDLELLMTFFSESYHKLIKCVNMSAWRLNKMLKEMSLFCFPQCRIDFSLALKSQITLFWIYSTNTLPGCGHDQESKYTTVQFEYSVGECRVKPKWGFLCLAMTE